MSFLVAGTYSGVVLVYSFSIPRDPPECLLAEEIHSGPIRCISSFRNYIVSGGRDESLCVYDINSGEVVGLPSPGGDVLSLCICRRGTAIHLFVGGSEGIINVYKRQHKKWEYLGDLVGHKGPVEAIYVESTGRVALTLSGKNERKLKLWDLVKGKCTVSQQFEQIPLKLALYNDKYYAVLFERSAILRSFKGNEKLIIPPESEKGYKFTCLAFFPGETLVIGTNKGLIYLVRYNSESLEIEQAEIAELCVPQRIKHILSIDNTLMAIVGEGEIKKWRFTSNWDFEFFSAFQSNAMITTVHIE